MLTASELFDTINTQLRLGHSEPVARKKNSPHFERSGIEAPRNFPLECGGETFVLIVSFTIARRDHYIRVLESGDAAERIHAIHELSQLIDEKANEAIREAVSCDSVLPAYQYDWKESSSNALTEKDVQNRAKTALESSE